MLRSGAILADMSLPVRILSVGSHTPSVRVTSEELDARYDRVPGATLARSGVRERRWIAPSESSLSMSVASLGQALGRAGLAIDELDAVIVASVSPEQPMPTTAVLAARALGASDGALEAFDVNASCLGFLTALQQAAFGITAGRWRRVAVAAVDVASKGLNHDDLESSALFGDGAAAVIVGPAEQGSEILSLRLRSYPSAAGLCRIPAGGTRWNVVTPPPDPTDYLFAMDGLGMMKLVARAMPGFLDEVLAEAGVTRDQLGVVVPHQASGLGLRFLRERLGVPAESVVDILAERGNQVSASMPSALATAIDSQRLKRGELCLLIGTGAGLVFGGAVLRY